jgi:hypothetical protein
MRGLKEVGNAGDHSRQGTFTNFNGIRTFGESDFDF